MTCCGLVPQRATSPSPAPSMIAFSSPAAKPPPVRRAMSDAHSSGSFHPGQKAGLGRFILDRELGRGGMGVVWLALDTELNEHVALKFIPPEIRSDAEALDELKRETQRSRRLTHPNIIRIHDFLRPEGEVPFIAMEYVEGKTLSALKIEQPQRLFTWEKLRPFAAQLCHALEYAHSEGVVHRDLKPGNMMLDARGRLKLADFGLAACISDSITRVSQDMGSSGTPAYMSPQQMDGRPSKPTDDIYALGATLYELLTSKPPFYTGDIFYQVRQLAPDSLEQRLTDLGLNNPIPPDVASLIMSCLAKLPEVRPQSASAVAEWIGFDSAYGKTSPRSLLGRSTEPVTLPAAEHADSADTMEAATPDLDSTSAFSKPPRRRLWPVVAFGLAAVAVAAIVFLKSKGASPSSSEKAPSLTQNDTSALAPPADQSILYGELRPGQWSKINLQKAAQILDAKGLASTTSSGHLKTSKDAYLPNLKGRSFMLRATAHFPKGAVWCNLGVGQGESMVYQVSVGRGWGDWTIYQKTNGKPDKVIHGNHWLTGQDPLSLQMTIAVTEKDFLAHIAEPPPGTRTGYLAVTNAISGQEIQPFLSSNAGTFSDVEIMLLDGVPESQWPELLHTMIQSAKRPR